MRMGKSINIPQYAPKKRCKSTIFFWINHDF